MVDGEWWYVKDGTRRGPHTISDLERKLISEEISANTRAWRKGMETWTKIKDIDALQDVLKECPPPVDDSDISPNIDLPDQSDLSPSISPQLAVNPAGPWSRFFARQIDLMIFGVIAWFILSWMFPGLTDAPELNNAALATFITIPLALLIEVPVLGLTGSTAGKWIFRISVRKVDGSRLSMNEIFRRNFVLWGQGLGLGIPLVNIYFLIKSFNIAKNGRRCPWDEVGMHNVCQTITNARWAFGFIAYVCLIVAVMAADTLDKMNRTTANPITAATMTKSQLVAWVNPLTNRSVDLYGGWAPVPKKIKDDPNVFMFENATSVVILGREVFRSGDLGTYIDALRANVDFGVLEDKKAEVDSLGVAYYLLTFRKVSENIRFHVDVKVWQTTSTNYWRSVVFTPLKNVKARAEARALAEILEKTSLIEIENEGSITRGKWR